MLAVFEAARRQQLHADTDAEERPAPTSDGFLHRGLHGGARAQRAMQSAKAPSPGSTMRSAARIASGVVTTSTSAAMPTWPATCSKARTAERILPAP